MINNRPYSGSPGNNNESGNSSFRQIAQSNLQATGLPDNFNVRLPAINLPRGGGAVKGIDEKFEVNAVNGTSTLSIPLPLTASRRGAPGLGLSYNSGAGNSAFGLGWQLGLSSIFRKTDNKLPQYKDAVDSDTYIINGAEDLVPLLEEIGGNMVPYSRPRSVGGVNYTVKRYRPRIEGSFLRIERWINNLTGEVHWKTISGQNVHSYYGLTNASRIEDPNDPSRIFEWKICRVHDDKGEITIFDYKKEDFAGIPNLIFEKNRIGNCTQLYLKKLLYGNKQPYYLGDPIPGENDFLFKTVFDYGEHDSSTPIPQAVMAESKTWDCRKDPFSTYRSGFEIRTYRRCRRVLMFHCFSASELPINPYLTKSLDFFYDDDLEFISNGRTEPGFSFLTRIRSNGHVWDATTNKYKTKSLPETELTFQQHEWDTEISAVTAANVVHAPAGLKDRRYLWYDLFSEGVSGILTEQAGSWYYKSNLGGGEFSNALPVANKPSFRGLPDGDVFLQDVRGDGSKCLVQMEAEPKGFFKLGDEEEWEPMKYFSSVPSINTRDPNIRPLDLTGDGMTDLLVTEDESFRWYEGLGENGFAVSKAVCKEIDEEKGPAILFDDDRQSIFLADMKGDGLTDIVRITNGEVCYWPNLGYGRFGRKVTMLNAPIFDYPDQFNPQHLRLADIDGSGTTDIVYLGKNDFRVWMNQNGNEWSSEAHIISSFPAINNLSDVAVLDFLGSGTACIVYSTSADGQPLWYIDIMKSRKPHLLTGYKNNCGKEVSLEYKSSTFFYLKDKKEGKAWATKLPFPVHCVFKTTVKDRISDLVFTCSYGYGHGYFDHEEREFRGFGRVEQLDTEEFSQFKLNESKNVVEEELHQAPIRTVTWYHTGAFFSASRIAEKYSREYFKNTAFTEHILPPNILPGGLTGEELREAYRALKGLPLRVEVYADDNLPQSKYPFSVAETTSEIRVVQHRSGQKYASFLRIPGESISYNYERVPADPQISHSFLLDADELGLPKKSASIVYRRKQRPSGANAIPDKVWEEQEKSHIVYSEALYTKDIDEDDIYRLRSSYENKGYEIYGITIAAGAFLTRQVLEPGIGGATEKLFDEEFVPGSVQKRLSSHSRGYFLKDDLSGPMDLGKLPNLGIGYKSYQLAFTQGLVTKYYSGKVNAGMLTDAKYVHSEGDAHWWSQGGETIFPANPKDHFYMPVGMRDVFGNESFVEYDNYDLVVKKATDAIGSVVTATCDYRTMIPVLVTDPNLNRIAVELDELGMVIKSAVMGKAGAGEGDTLDSPTSRLEYDLMNWKVNGKPNYVHTYTREKHGDAATRWQESYAYADGGGNVIMIKAQANPGKARRWNAVDKKVDEVDADPRWVGNGRTIVNNKGNAVKSFDPYFSTTHEYENEDALVEAGYSSIIYYDAAGRNICTKYPNGSFSKVEFDGWYFKAFDVNDTVKDSQWYIDRGSPDPDVDPEPNDPDKRAAWLAARHDNTPGVAHTDALGRNFYGITDYGGGKTVSVWTESDLAGRYSKVFDQKGRMVAESYNSLLGTVMYGKSAEKGEKWTFMDVMGRLVKIWENADLEYYTKFDKLHRPVSSFVRENGNEILFSHVHFGDGLADAVQKNLKGKAYKVFDQAGELTISQVDFKGNVLTAKRRLASEYKQSVNWDVLDGITDINLLTAAAGPLLENEEFVSTSTLDALNRPVSVTLPDNSVVKPTYNIANFLDRLEVKVRGQGAFREFLKGQDFDAKGQRQYVEYGNDLITNYFYEARTFRLINLVTKKAGDPDSASLQNLHYTFDPAGNIVYQVDEAQQTHFFNNAVVKPESRFEYDAIYQLKKATGRELAGLGGADQQRDHQDLGFVNGLPHLNNASAVRNYTELYSYDDLGNINKLQHVATNGNWTQEYRYEIEDNPLSATNRLTRTSMPGDPAGGPYTALYEYDSRGNMSAMPHLPGADSLRWNFAAHLKEVNLGGGGRAYYVYGVGGNRVRKIIERQGGKRLERIYLGVVEIYREYQNNVKRFERNTLHILDGASRIAQVDSKLLDLDNIDPVNTLNADLIRYQYGNHLGSSTMETDEAGTVISYEEYHPYGTSAYRSSKNGVDLSLKRYRFSGKEKDDETGFYYFGARYYAPWIGRWTSADPAGFVRGFNLFKYCSNSPVVFHDPNGMQDVHVVVRDRRLGRNASFSDITANIPSGYHLRPGITAENYRQNWNAGSGIWDVLEEDSRQTPASGGSGLGETGQRGITANPEGPTIEVPNNFDNPKIEAMQERILDPTDRQIGHRSADASGSRTDDIRAANEPMRRAYNRSLPPAQRASRKNNIDIDHTVELQHIIRQPNPANERVRPQDHRSQNASTNRSQGRSARTVADDQIARGVPEDVPAGGVARTSEMGLLRNSPRARLAARGVGYGLMAAGPIMNLYGASQVENDLVRYSAYGLGGAEALGVGAYAVGRWGMGGSSATAGGLRVMGAGAGVARFAGGGATIVLSTYALVTDYQAGEYGVMLGDTAGIVAGGAMLAGSGPVAAVAGGVAVTNAAGDWVERKVTPEYGRPAGVGAGTAAGAALGAGIGAAVGVWFFGVGAAPGAAVGAVVGGIAGFVGAYW